MATHQFLHENLRHLYLKGDNSADGQGFSPSDMPYGVALVMLGEQWTDEMLLLAAQIAYRYRNQLSAFSRMTEPQFVESLVEEVGKDSLHTPRRKLSFVGINETANTLLVFGSKSKLAAAHRHSQLDQEFVYQGGAWHIHLNQEPDERIWHGFTKLVTPALEPVTFSDTAMMAIQNAGSVPCMGSVTPNPLRAKDALIVRFREYDKTLIEEFKRLFPKARYFSQSKAWGVFPTKNLLSWLEGKRFYVDEKAQALLEASKYFGDLSLVDGDICLSLNYPKTELLSEIRAIKDATYQAENRQWLFPVTAIEDVMNLVNTFEIMLAESQQKIRISNLKQLNELRSLFNQNHDIDVLIVCSRHDASDIHLKIPYDAQINTFIKSHRLPLQWLPGRKRWKCDTQDFREVTNEIKGFLEQQNKKVVYLSIEESNRIEHCA